MAQGRGRGQAEGRKCAEDPREQKRVPHEEAGRGAGGGGDLAGAHKFGVSAELGRGHALLRARGEPDLEGGAGEIPSTDGRALAPADSREFYSGALELQVLEQLPIQESQYAEAEADNGRVAESEGGGRAWGENSGKNYAPDQRSGPKDPILQAVALHKANNLPDSE